MLAALFLAAMLAAAATPAPRLAAPQALRLAAPQALRPGEPVEIQVHENTLVGEFASPADTARHPAVIVLGGMEGGIPGESFGFAIQGYAAFSMAYFGADPLPKAIERIPVERVSRAIDWVRDRPEVDPNRIGIVALSNGSELALLAALRDTRIKSIAVISPSAYVWFAPKFDGNPDRSSWTLNNGEVPYIPVDERAENEFARTAQRGGTYQFRDLYDASLRGASAEAVKNAAIPVERISAPILCVAGDDDREWDSAAACKTIAARRKAAGRDARDQVAIEPGAGHTLTLGGRPSPETVPAGKMTIRLGGNPAANARGGADAWNRTLTFLAKTL